MSVGMSLHPPGSGARAVARRFPPAAGDAPGRAADRFVRGRPAGRAGALAVVTAVTAVTAVSG